VLALIGFTLGAIGCLSTLPVFWSQAPYLLRGAAAAGGTALICAIGNIAGFVSPYMVALIKGEGPGLGNSAAAVITTAVFLALAAAAIYGSAGASAAAPPPSRRCRPSTARRWRPSMAGDPFLDGHLKAALFRRADPRTSWAGYSAMAA